MRRTVALVLLLAAARAEEHATLNFAIEWPTGEGWGAAEDWPGAAGALSRGVSNDDLGRALHVVVVGAPGATLERDGYVRGLLKGMSADLPGARVVSERRHEIAGVPALTLHLDAESDGLPLRLVHLAVLADDRLYSITATARSGDGDWAENAFAGFRFLRQPAPPTARTAAERIGYGFGRYVLGPLLLGGLGVGLVLLVRRIAGRGRGRAST